MMRVLNKNSLLSHGNREGRKIALDILEKGLAAADPYDNTLKILRRDGNIISLGNDEFVPKGSPRTGIDEYIIGKDIDRIFVFGAGKGIQRIAKAIEDVLGDAIAGGLIIVKDHDEHSLSHIDVCYASHPVPDESCLTASKRLLESINKAKLTDRDLVFVIIGNGASSMMTYPWDGISLDAVADVTRILQIEKGLITPKLNIVRNQLDRLKGGRITRYLAKAKLVHLFPIDLDEPNAYNASGYYGHLHNNFWLHSLPDISTPEKAIDILKASNTWNEVDASIRDYLVSAPAENRVLSPEEFELFDNRVFGLMPQKYNFISAVMNYSREIGYEPHFLMRRTFVDASTTGELISRIALNVENEEEPFYSPCLLLLTGEMIVAVDGKKGIGGRNQEFALGAAKVLSGSKRIVSVSVDTDGTDGPGGDFDPDATRLGCNCLSGGIVDGYTITEGSEKGIDFCKALEKHDASQALWNTDNGIWSIHNISIQDLIFMLVMDHDGSTE